MGEFEAVGDVVTGGIIGRAVEPRAGEPGADGHTHEQNCLNCGTPLQGEFCHACGQHAHVHRTLRAFFHDFLHGVLHFEGKIWNTLPLLAWRPGELARRYIDGERARFVSPVALFLFCVFLLFATVSLTGDLNGPAGAALHANLSSDIADAQERVTELEASRIERREEGKPTAQIDGKITGAKAKLAALQSRQKDGGGAVVVSDDMPGWLRPILGKATDNPELLAYKLKTNAYKFSWALIPISVPFLWLLFPFSRKFRSYDHTIFVTYSLSFMTLLFIAYLLLSSAGLSSIAALASFIPPLHMYRQLRGAYGLSRSSAVWRTLLMILFAFMAISLFVSLLVGIGVFD
jgi:hypothetical protein